MELFLNKYQVTDFIFQPGDVPSWFSKGKVGRPKRDPITGIIVPQKRIMSDVTAQVTLNCFSFIACVASLKNALPIYFDHAPYFNLCLLKDFYKVFFHLSY